MNQFHPSLRTICIVASVLGATPHANARELKTEHVLVTYDGIDEPHAQAIAGAIEAARKVCIDRYKFDMPQQIKISVAVNAREHVRLFNDGVDTFSLTLRSDQDLRKPATTGTFHLYGLCHEVAHLAMYRPITERGWLTTAGAEGWAHYLGSHLVDAVYELEGEDLWPDRYDYRADGSKRLQAQIASKRPSEPVQGAIHWGKFEAIAGRDHLATIFAAWGQAKINPASPGSDLAKAVKDEHGDVGKLKAWLVEADSDLFLKRPQSKFPVRQFDKRDLVGAARELAHDDGRSAGKKSVAGGGHAVRFEVPDNSSSLVSVSLFGSRYGAARAPQENFSVWLCDDEFRAITEFKFPYAKFERGDAKWVKLPVKPTAVPQKFIICFGFNPSAQKGVYVSHDAAGSGKSLSGLPGRPPRDFDAGDWLIRVEVDQTKGSDALRSDQ